MASLQNPQASSSSTEEPIRRMTKVEYQLECLRRSSAFERRVLKFHGKYPKVFVVRDGMPPVRDLPTLRAPHWREQPRRWRQRQEYPRQPLPVRKSRGGRVLVGKPQTMKDLEVLNGFATQTVLTRWYRSLRPENGQEYFTALGSGSRQKWEADFDRLAARWPSVPRSCLRWPWAASFRPRPQLLSAHQSQPAGVIVLPAVAGYDDTTKAEFDAACEEVWKLFVEARRQRRRARGKCSLQRRARPDVCAVRLRVYDAVSRLRNYSAVSKELRLPESTVRRHYAQAFIDIEGSPLTVTNRKRRATGIEIRRQILDCQRCFTSPDKPDFCSSHRAAGEAYIGQDHKAQRESLRDPIALEAAQARADHENLLNPLAPDLVRR